MLPSLQKVVFAHAALSSGIGFYHFPSSTLNPAAPSAAGNDLLSRVPGLRDDAVNFRTVMQGIAQNFHQPNLRKSLLATLQAVNASIASVELDSISEPQRARAVVGHTANGRVFDLLLEQESDGLRRFYAHLLALYQTPSKLTMVFEEPENAIFPGALSVLADEFKAAPGEHRGQIILTTHSPTLLDAFDVDCVRAVEMREGRTVVGPVAEDQRASVKDHILTTGELLTADQPRAQTQ
jgi:predicted ATPase